MYVIKKRLSKNVIVFVCLLAIIITVNFFCPLSLNLWLWDKLGAFLGRGKYLAQANGLYPTGTFTQMNSLQG